MTHSHRRHAVATGAALVACALLASCSSATHNKTAAAGTDGGTRSSIPAAAPSVNESVASLLPAAGTDAATACALITQQDIIAVLGADPGAGGGAVRAKGSTCGYAGTLPLSVNVTMVPANGKATYDYAKTSDPGSGDTVVDVPGIGDGAFGIFHAPLATVEFYKGVSFVSVLVTSTTGDTSITPKDQALALAKIAAARV